MRIKEILRDTAGAILDTVKSNAEALVNIFLLGPIIKGIDSELNPSMIKGMPALLSMRSLSTIGEDGIVLDGYPTNTYAKFTIRKGLPGPDEKRMAIENEPHSIDDFNGIIKSGYGKGEKKLLYSGNAVIKIGGELPAVKKINIHQHRADRAGLHYDLVFEGVKPNTKQFEVNIPSGEFKGRYAFLRPAGFIKNQLLVNRMKEEDIVFPKPKTSLKPIEFLNQVDKEPGNWITEWKPDGSVGIAHVVKDRVVFTSHREQAPPYYDKLPALEWLRNRTPLLTNRLLFPIPSLNGTVFMGELFHPEGAPRVSGILNSGADKAIIFQKKHGPVEYIVWDIYKYKGKDVTHLPYSERRILYEQAINRIRRFNKLYHTPWAANDGTSLAFYEGIVTDPRGLPYSEGVVVKRLNGKPDEVFYKIKHREYTDAKVLDILEGTGKFAGSVGKLVVETPDGNIGEVGSLRTTDTLRQWIWDNRSEIIRRGDVAEITVQEKTSGGSIRAGVFERWHPSKSEIGIQMYSEVLDSDNPISMMYKLKNRKR